MWGPKGFLAATSAENAPAADSELVPSTGCCFSFQTGWFDPLAERKGECVGSCAQVWLGYLELFGFLAIINMQDRTNGGVGRSDQVGAAVRRDKQVERM